MKKIILVLISLSSILFADCYLSNDKKVICNGKQIGEVWCGFTGCEGYCKNGRIYGKVKKYGNKEKAAQSVVSECKK